MLPFTKLPPRQGLFRERSLFADSGLSRTQGSGDTRPFPLSELKEDGGETGMRHRWKEIVGRGGNERGRLERRKILETWKERKRR